MSKIAIITGITGQDGSYLAELLIQKKYKVHGFIRKKYKIKLSYTKLILTMLGD